jgi:hypothetical protein
LAVDVGLWLAFIFYINYQLVVFVIYGRVYHGKRIINPWFVIDELL